MAHKPLIETSKYVFVFRGTKIPNRKEVEENRIYNTFLINDNYFTYTQLLEVEEVEVMA